MCSSMADGVAPSMKQKKLAPPTTAPNKKNPSKLYSHFFFKALIIAISLITIPLFTSESPDYSPSISTKWWELLHLIFVGIAVSYGLFSRRNEVGDDGDVSERESSSKLDNAHSYMSRFLQLPSIFGDEVENNPSGSDYDNNNKVQTWSSQYHRNQPLFLVAKSSSVALEKPVIDEKPLLLPVRSLKTRISDRNDNDLADGVDSGVSRVYSRSNSMPVAKESSNHSRIDGGFVSGATTVYPRSSLTLSEEGFSNDPRSMNKRGSMMKSSSSRGFSSSSIKASSGNYRNFDDDEDEGEQEKKFEKESVVLSSPIPWQSRSRMIGLNGESNGSQSFKSQSPSTTLPSESQSKMMEEFRMRKVVHNSRHPPPPPPPPPPQIPRSRRAKPSSTIDHDNISMHHTEPQDIGRENRVKSLENEAIKKAAENEATPGKNMRPMSRECFSEFSKETKDFLDEVLAEETDFDTDSDDNDSYDESKEKMKGGKVEELPSNSITDEGPDVDKKADEFIAKFREQIRLQRIESIKRSTRQLKRSPEI